MHDVINHNSSLKVSLGAKSGLQGKGISSDRFRKPIPFLSMWLVFWWHNIFYAYYAQEGTKQILGDHCNSETNLQRLPRTPKPLRSPAAIRSCLFSRRLPRVVAEKARHLRRKGINPSWACHCELSHENRVFRHATISSAFSNCISLP